jgi:hypothetical protein
MALGKPRDPRKEQQWRRWLRQWQHSGLTVRAFCELHQLSQPSFYAWRRQIQLRDAATATAPFLPVRVVTDASHVLPGRSTPLEIVLPGNRTLRVAAGFDAATLRQLLAVLQEVPGC